MEVHLSSRFPHAAFHACSRHLSVALSSARYLSGKETVKDDKIREPINLLKKRINMFTFRARHSNLDPIAIERLTFIPSPHTFPCPNKSTDCSLVACWLMHSEYLSLPLRN